MALKLISVRLPEEIVDKLPPASLSGERAKFIREAVKEKLTREARKKDLNRNR